MKVGDSQETRHEVISIRFDKDQNQYIVSEPRVLEMVPSGSRESTTLSKSTGFVGSDGLWYLVRGPVSGMLVSKPNLYTPHHVTQVGITQKVMQLQVTGNHRTISLLPLPGPLSKKYEREGSVSVERVEGLYLRYPTVSGLNPKSLPSLTRNGKSHRVQPPVRFVTKCLRFEVNPLKIEPSLP